MMINQFAHVMRFYSFTTFSNNPNIKQRKKKMIIHSARKSSFETTSTFFPLSTRKREENNALQAEV